MTQVYAGVGSWETTQDSIGAHINSLVCALEYRVEQIDARTSHSPSLNFIRLGDVKVLHCVGRGLHRSIRASYQIRQDRLDDILLVVPLQAQVAIKQEGRLAQVGPESFTLVSTSKPFTCVSSPTDSRNCFSCNVVSIPATLVRERLPRIDGCYDQNVRVRPGAGKIMVNLFELALAEGGALTDKEAQSFGSTLIDAVVSATLGAPELRDSRSARPETALVKIQMRAKNFIECKLSDPELSHDDIAQHCRVSVRYLNTAFAAQSTTVGAFIREKRLEQCRRALLNPILGDQSIIGIAMKWGFNDAAYFSRAYKARFGSAPSVDRRLAIPEHT